MDQHEPYPELDALMARLSEDDPARVEYEALRDEREALIRLVELGAADQRLIRAAGFLQAGGTSPPEDRKERGFQLLFTAFGLDSDKDGWIRVIELLTAYTDDPSKPLTPLVEAPTQEDQWQAPVLADETLLECKRRYPSHDVERCIADFIAWLSRGRKMSKNPDAAFSHLRQSLDCPRGHPTVVASQATTVALQATTSWVTMTEEGSELGT
ncbi:MAG: hypothetical protein ABI895_37115 [Deltaproteobacteria bacterium]